MPIMIDRSREFHTAAVVTGDQERPRGGPRDAESIARSACIINRMTKPTHSRPYLDAGVFWLCGSPAIVLPDLSQESAIGTDGSLHKVARECVTARCLGEVEQRDDQ